MTKDQYDNICINLGIPAYLDMEGEINAERCQDLGSILFSITKKLSEVKNQKPKKKLFD